jgi:hypothetical protein
MALLSTTTLRIVLHHPPKVQHVLQDQGQASVGASASLIEGLWPVGDTISVEGSYDQLAWDELLQLTGPGTPLSVASVHKYLRVSTSNTVGTAHGVVAFSVLLSDTAPDPTGGDGGSEVLDQTRPSVTTPVEVLTGPANVTFVSVCNTSGGAAFFSLFHSQDQSPAVYDETTALHWQTPVVEGDTVYIEWPQPLVLAGSDDTLAVQSSVADALTFTVYGDS